MRFSQVASFCTNPKEAGRGMRLFRAGVYEYDKKPTRRVTLCIRCGREIEAGKNRKNCGPCADDRYKETVAKAQKAYRARRRAKKAARAT